LFSTLVVALAVLPQNSSADGLYKGHGLRSDQLVSGAVPTRQRQPQYQPPPPPPKPELTWAVRLNLSGGLAGAYRVDDINRYGYTSGYKTGAWDQQFGGYVNFAFEFPIGRTVTLEPFGTLGSIDELNNVVNLTAGPSAGVFRSDNTRIYGVGGNLRKHWPWKNGTMSLGIGGGYLYSRAEWFDVDENTTALFQDEAPEAHFTLGTDFYLSKALSLGFEFGWRWTWLDNPNQFQGAMLGLRMSVMVPK